MTNLERQHEIVKKSLVNFVSAHIPEADFSVIDDIVLTYIISVLEDASQDPTFDVSSFVEMLNPYFSEFSTIDESVICEWIYKLENELSEIKKHPVIEVTRNISLDSLCLSDIIPESKLCARTAYMSEKEDKEDSVDNGNKSLYNLSETIDCASTESSSCEYFFDEVEVLQEMFPETSLVEVKHCICIAKGDIDSATQILLHRQENGQNLTDKSNLSNRKNVVDDAELKNRIIARYSYVDKNATHREYRPVVPKMEPKKLVRYRDNKIVSLKGERYTEIKANEDVDFRKTKKATNP